MLNKSVPWFVLDFLFLIGGGATIVITRWLLKSRYLFHWDSVQFVLALKEFDVSQHQPHPPGYIIYVYLGKLFNFFVEDPNLAFIALGVVASIAGLIILFYLAKMAFTRTAAYIAALLFIFNPLVWFHGLVAEVYIVEMFFVLFFVFLAYRYYQKQSLLDLIGTVLTLGILGGIRQSAEVVMLPLFILVLVKGGASIKKWIASLAGLAIINLTWFIPVLVMSGGWQSYFEALGALTQATVVYEYVHGQWNALTNNFSMMITIFKQAFLLGLFILIMAAFPLIAEESRGKYKINWSHTWFWLVATIPSILIMPVILMRNSGYVLSAMSLIIIIAAVAAIFLAQVMSRWKSAFFKPVITILTGLALVTQIGNFFTLKFSDFYYLSASIDSIRTVDEFAGDIIQTVRKKFNSDESAIWIPGDYVFFGVRHFQYYLPEYKIYSYAPQSFVGTSPELPIWYIHGVEANKFVKTISPDAHIRYLIAARNTLQADDYQILVETEGGHNMSYYDLSDENTVAFLNKDTRFDIQSVFEGGSNE